MPTPSVRSDVVVPRIDPRRLQRVLLVALAAQAVLFVATHLLAVAGHPTQLGLRRLFNLDGEGTVGAWFSSSLMLCIAAALALSGAAAARLRDRFARHWWALAAAFVYLSVDETAQIHEMLSRPVRWLGVSSEGWLGTGWVVVGMAVAVALAVGFARFLAALPRATAIAFVVAGACFVGGAVGVEVFSERLAEVQGLKAQPGDWGSRGDFTTGYMLLVLLEESLEMLGLILFLRAVLERLQGAVAASAQTAAVPDATAAGRPAVVAAVAAADAGSPVASP